MTPEDLKTQLANIAPWSVSRQPVKEVPTPIASKASFKASQSKPVQIPADWVPTQWPLQTPVMIWKSIWSKRTATKWQIDILTQGMSPEQREFKIQWLRDRGVDVGIPEALEVVARRVSDNMQANPKDLEVLFEGLSDEEANMRVKNMQEMWVTIEKPKEIKKSNMFERAGIMKLVNPIKKLVYWKDNPLSTGFNPMLAPSEWTDAKDFKEVAFNEFWLTPDVFAWAMKAVATLPWDVVSSMVSVIDSDTGDNINYWDNIDTRLQSNQLGDTLWFEAGEFVTDVWLSSVAVTKLLNWVKNVKQLQTIAVQYPKLSKVLKWVFVGATEWATFDIANQWEVWLENPWIWGALGWVLAWVSVAAWPLANKLYVSGLLNPKKLEYVANALKETGDEVENIVNRMFDRSIKGSKQTIVSDLDTLAAWTREEVKNITKKSTWTFKEQSAINALEEMIVTLKDPKSTKVQWRLKEVEDLRIKANKWLTLNEMQRTKELMDETFDIYTVAWDARAGVVKEDLAWLRQDLRKFIEDTANAQWLWDVRKLNRDTAVAKQLSKYINYKDKADYVRDLVSPFAWPWVWWAIWFTQWDTREERAVNGLIWAAFWKIASSTTVKTNTWFFLKKASWFMSSLTAQETALIKKIQDGKDNIPSVPSNTMSTTATPTSVTPSYISDPSYDWLNKKIWDFIADNSDINQWVKAVDDIPENAVTQVDNSLKWQMINATDAQLKELWFTSTMIKRVRKNNATDAPFNKVETTKSVENLTSDSPTSTIDSTLWKTKAMDNLATEAKKYKTADEFVENQWEKLFHWTNKKFDDFDINKSNTKRNIELWAWVDAIYFTKSKDIAWKYSKAWAIQNISKESVSTIKDKDLRDMAEIILNGKNSNASTTKIKELKNILNKKHPTIKETRHKDWRHKTISEMNDHYQMINDVYDVVDFIKNWWQWTGITWIMINKQANQIPKSIVESMKKLWINQKYLPEPRVVETRLSKDARIKKWVKTQKEVKQAMKEWYDWVERVKEDDLVYWDSEIVIFSTDKIKTESQLKKIREEANK